MKYLLPIFLLISSGTYLGAQVFSYSMKNTILSLALLLTFTVQAQEKVILDTDPAYDPDDVGCMAMLQGLASNEECEILAIMNSTDQKESTLCISAINQFYNRSAIPIGDYKGYPEKKDASENTYDYHIAQDFDRTLKRWEDSYDGVRLYREILESAEDKSITVIIIGTMHNFYALLKSQPDEWSYRTGQQLVADKVKQVVTMGGNFLTHQGYDRTNWGGADTLCAYTSWSCLNEERNRMCRYVIENCPAPFIASGWENGNGDYYNAKNGNVMTGQGLKQLPEDHIVRQSYERHFEYRGGADDISRHSNDQCALHYAVRGEGENYTAYTNGTITLMKNGACTWDATINRQQGHIQKNRNDDLIATEIEELMMAPTPSLDTSPPSAPSLTSMVKLGNQRAITWTAAEDSTPGSWVVAYSIYQDGELIQQAYGTKCRLAGTPGQYSIRAMNASGTLSEPTSFRIE